MLAVFCARTKGIMANAKRIGKNISGQFSFCLRPPNPLGGAQRRRGGHSKRRACRTAPPVGEPKATGLAVGVRSSRCGLGASLTTEPTPEPKTPTGADYKPARRRWRRWPRPQASLKPYWGKPAVRNSRGGQRKRSGGSGGHLPRCPKGRIHWKPLTYSCSRLCSTRW